MKFATDFILASHKAIKHPYIGLFFGMLAIMAFHAKWKTERVDVSGGI